METLSYTSARQNLKTVMDKVCDDKSPLIITRQNDPDVVMMSLEDYNSLLETAYLLRSPKNAARLAKAIKDVEKGKVKRRELKE